MAVGKYRQKHTWYDSKFGGMHEELLTEGVSAGRSWAVIKSWRPEPRYLSDRFEEYILRVDISEWYAAYGLCICRMSDEMRRICMSIKGGISPLEAVWFNNMSPGWWENGFSQQLCLESTVFLYASEADRFRSIVETGLDWDTLDYDVLVSDLCIKLNPLFKLFAKSANRRISGLDDF